MNEIRKWDHIGIKEWFERIDKLEYFYELDISFSNSIKSIGERAGISFQEFAEGMAEINRIFSDDWKLKNLYLEIESQASKYGLNCNTCTVEDIIEKHLKILQQKLIEDINNNGMWEIPVEEIKEIINKRFGVEK